MLRQLQSIFLLLLWTNLSSAEEETGDPMAEETEPVNAILFPFFVLLLGVMIYYVLEHFAPAIPYTGAMFLLGTIIGVGVERAGNENVLSESIRLWLQIDSEVLLSAFLPGLLFKDAVSVELHLFKQAFLQCLIFAFPLVLAGASLTALVFYYIIPYDWSWNLAMTGGSILAATDTVGEWESRLACAR